MTVPAVAASESARLRGKLALALPTLFAAGRRFYGDPRIRDLYPEFLFATHCVIRASVPLMAAARDRAASLGDGDSVASAVARYLGEHIADEVDHDAWLLEDLTSLGIDPGSVLRRPPAPAVAQLVGAQYYWIFHYHPVALLGYIALLEGYPPVPAEIEGIRARTGQPAEAFRTLLMHAELDPGHRDELDEVIDALPLSPEQRMVIGLSAISSVELLARVIDEVVASAGAIKSPAD